MRDGGMDFSNVSKAVEQQKPEVVAKKGVLAQGTDTAVAEKEREAARDGVVKR